MKITLAKSAGFCFGVRRAVETVEQMLRENKAVCTLGPIIHNPQLVADLEKRGVQAIDTPAEVPQNATLVIRSHGIPAETMQDILHRKILFEDATCPFVAKIHRIVQQAAAEGKWILIAGDRKHPEVIGIQSHCKQCSSVFSNCDELDDLLKTLQVNGITSVCVVAQTTFRIEEWKNCLKKIKIVYTNAAVFDTICKIGRAHV